jgi:hypothetical protein
MRGCGMCDKCVELDGKIERMRLLIADQVTVDRIKELVAEMKARKAEFHADKG